MNDEPKTPSHATAMFIRDVAVFCLQHGGHLYRGWSGALLFQYLAFQWLDDSLIVIHNGRETAGVFIAWNDFAAEISRREKDGDYHFGWRRATAGGDALMIADVIVAPGDRRSLTRLLQVASARWPDWKMRRVFTHRRGKLVELPAAVLARFFHEQSIHT